MLVLKLCAYTGIWLTFVFVVICVNLASKKQADIEVCNEKLEELDREFESRTGASWQNLNWMLARYAEDSTYTSSLYEIIEEPSSDEIARSEYWQRKEPLMTEKKHQEESLRYLGASLMIAWIAFVFLHFSYNRDLKAVILISLTLVATYFVGYKVTMRFYHSRREGGEFNPQKIIMYVSIVALVLSVVVTSIFYVSEIPPMPTFVREALAESALSKNEFEELYVETDLELPYFDETLNAYVFVYPHELATEYVLLRENRKVIVFCQDDGSGCSVREIYFDYIPSRSTERYWRTVNNFTYYYDGYRGSMWSSMTTGQTTYQLELGENSLMLDAHMMDLIDLALDGKATWKQTEYGEYMENDTINLSELLSHFGYSFVGTERDVPRGGMTDDFIAGDWRVYRNESGDAVYLMVKNDWLIWGQCKTQDFKLAFVPMQLFEEDFETKVILDDGSTVYANDPVLGMLLQFTEYQYYGCHSVLDDEGQ